MPRVEIRRADERRFARGDGGRRLAAALSVGSLLLLLVVGAIVGQLASFAAALRGTRPVEA